jgi:hypothetical protein
MEETNDYMPVDPDFLDVLEKERQNSRRLKVFYFVGLETIDSVTGTIERIHESGEGSFCSIDGKYVYLDRIITLNGRPGPAYDAYDAFSNACLRCDQEL